MYCLARDSLGLFVEGNAKVRICVDFNVAICKRNGGCERGLRGIQAVCFVNASSETNSLSALVLRMVDLVVEEPGERYHNCEYEEDGAAATK